MLSLPGYTVIEKLHDSAETTIYRGHRDGDLKPVAIKRVRDEHASPRSLAKLRHEHAVLADLNCSGIPQALALEKSGPSVALVVELADATPLNELIQAKVLDLEAALHIAASLSTILGFVHGRAIIHKDVKPHNILFNPGTKSVYLIDFGISTRLAHETQKLAPPNSLEGTLAYMSPEQTGRMNRVIDRRTDFYSLGVTLYEMLTGDLPFRSEDPTQLIYSHLARAPKSPSDRHPGIPRIVSAVVLKLLAKTGEDRYQDAGGLKADLDECLRQWRQKRAVDEFPLGQYDFPTELRIPQKLYGRENALQALLTAFGRVHRGGIEMVLVNGQPGIGKSALVQELHKSIAQTGGYYLAGKFDQLSRTNPYQAIAHALSGLVRQVLSEKGPAVARWRDLILAAVGNNGQILIDLIADVQLIIGPQSAVPILGPTESQNRFNLVFQNFIQLFAARQPLVLALDDLQWADAGSLRLLHQLLTDSEQRHLLIVGAYRDSEVDATHPLSNEIANWRKAGVHVHDVTLTSLTNSHLAGLIKDSLGCDTQSAGRLAELVSVKTHGNPLFAIQFLTMLYEERLLVFDTQKRAWTWDEAALAQQEVTENVVELMIGKLLKLPDAAQNLLTLAACIGYEFELRTLVDISGKSLDNIVAVLWPTIQSGLVIPLDADYRLLPTKQDGLSAYATAELGSKLSLRFFHDRMRQAAYELLPAARRPEVHLRIGRSLIKVHGDQPHAAKLFDIVDHLNFAVHLITDPAQRLHLAKQNLKAGQQAKASTAYAAAANYYRQATELFADSAWEQDHELCFRAYEERAECEYLAGSFELAEKHFDVLLTQARSDLERVRVYDRQLVLHLALGRLERGLALGQKGLLLFGIELPKSPPELFGALQQEMGGIMAKLGDRSIASLVDGPLLQDPWLYALMQLLMDLHPLAFLINPILAQLISAKQVNLSLSHGNSPLSAWAYTGHAVFVASQLGQYRAAYAFGKLAIDLSERFDSKLIQGRSNNVFGSFVSFNCQPVSESLEHMRRSLRLSLEVGDFQYASYSCIHITAIRLASGEPLALLREELGHFLTLTQRSRTRLAFVSLQIYRQFISALDGHTASTTRLDDSTFDELAFVNKINDERLVVAVFIYYQIKLQLYFLYDDYVSALAMAQQSDARAMFGAGAFCTVENSVYTVLTLIQLLRTSEGEERTLYTALLDKHKARLAALAQECPHNFQPQLTLIEAELAVLEGHTVQAMKLFEQAIELARQSEFVTYEALANELAARFFLRLGLPKVAGLYMSQAHYAYIRWGATAKANQLADKYGYILLQLSPSSPSMNPLPSDDKYAISTRTIVGGLFDISALMRATQSISMEIMLDKVLHQVLRIVLTTAGGQRGFLILVQDDRLIISATTTVDQEQVELGMNLPLEEEVHIARSVVQYVAQSNEPVVLADATRDSRFASDPYVVSARPKSLLCMPLPHHGRPIGVMYLENNLAVGAFRSDRIELLRMLCAQAAIAVENARLYSRVQAITDQLRGSNSELNEINQRLLAATTQIEHTNADLTESNRRLEFELTERVRGEAERAALQNTIIQNQQARLAELSTPLIPLTDKIMVLPLIGSVDAQRAEQVLETVLHGSSIHSTEIVIIDITGLRHVDTSAANSLIKTASALRLLGAEAVLTGIRAEVAQTLVGLGIDLGQIVIRSTLQMGISYALTRNSRSLKKFK